MDGSAVAAVAPMDGSAVAAAEGPMDGSAVAAAPTDGSAVAAAPTAAWLALGLSALRCHLHLPYVRIPYPLPPPFP